jgi:hypothetical protein
VAFAGRADVSVVQSSGSFDDYIFMRSQSFIIDGCIFLVEAGNKLIF